MPYLETVEEFVEELADYAGIYNQGLRFDGLTRAESRFQTDWNRDHATDGGCRACWCGVIARRIRTAVQQERLITFGKEAYTCQGTTGAG